MANTYTQIYIHIVFAVKGLQNLIHRSVQDELYKYITGIITNKEQKLIAINGMPDHIHILIGLRADKSLSDIARDIKANSSRFINEKRLVLGKFEWQTGFGAFSVGRTELFAVNKYIENQEDHHKAISFKDEYVALLEQCKIMFDKKYIFDDVGDAAPTELPT
jgi:REP element-mobilizing transposase RayT